jgi:hypothetical protein
MSALFKHTKNLAENAMLVGDKVVFEGPISTSFKDTQMRLTVGRPTDVQAFFKGDIRDVIVVD